MNSRVAEQRILRGTAGTLRWTHLDENGTPSDPGAAVSVTVTEADGTAVTSGSATETGTAKTGEHTFALTAAQTASLHLLTVTWAVSGGGTFTTYAEVVGGFYFSLEDARKSDATLADVVKYPDALMLEVRREVEDEFEDITGVAFVPRYARLTLPGSGSAVLQPGARQIRSLRSARQYSDLSTASYTSLSASEIAAVAVSSTALTRTDGVWWDRGAGNLVIEIEHGYDRPPPTLKRAALTRLRHRLNFTKSGIPDRAQSFVVAEGGTFSLGQASKRKTGIPEVDAELARYFTPDVLVA